MNYYIYLNFNGLTEEQQGEIIKFARELQKSGFKGIEGNTIYVTWYDNKPYIYKVEKNEEFTDAQSDPFSLDISKEDNFPIFNITIIDELIKM